MQTHIHTQTMEINAQKIVSHYTHGARIRTLKSKRERKLQMSGKKNRGREIIKWNEK